MDDKIRDAIGTLDTLLRNAYPTGMREGPDITIRKMTGFELHNTRPYHNYETWSTGYEVFDDQHRVEAEDLFSALFRVLLLKRLPQDAQPWEMTRKEIV